MELTRGKVVRRSGDRVPTCEYVLLGTCIEWSTGANYINFQGVKSQHYYTLPVAKFREMFEEVK